MSGPDLIETLGHILREIESEKKCPRWDAAAGLAEALTSDDVHCLILKKIRDLPNGNERTPHR